MHAARRDDAAVGKHARREIYAVEPLFLGRHDADDVADLAELSGFTSQRPHSWY